MTGSRTISYRKEKINEKRSEIFVPLSDLLTSPPQNGYSPVCPEVPTGKWILGLSALSDKGLDLSQAKPAPTNEPLVDRFQLCPGDFLISRSNTLDKVGRVALYHGGLENCSYPDLMMRFRTDPIKVDSEYLEAYLRSEPVQRYIQCHATGTSGSMKKINQAIVEAIPVLLLPLIAQRKIASILSTWDTAIEKTERLIAAKTQLQKALAKRLLFGLTRLGGRVSDSYVTSHWFKTPSDWEVIAIGNVANEVSVTNNSASSIPVLSCTKYDGLVDSLKYFGKQIFASDTSNYKIVKRGQFAYATNHLEEGSIGYQTAYPAGLVSPIYTVFETDKARVNDGYLFKLLKIETFRHLFEVNTSASVDRRGSLRWSQFAQIKIPLPSLREQTEINAVLEIGLREITLLKDYLRLLDKQKRGLMQKLLTGQWRVKVEDTEAA